MHGRQRKTKPERERDPYIGDESSGEREANEKYANVHGINQGRLAVINVGNDGNVAHGVIATGRRVDFSLLLHRSSIDADRGGLEPRRLLERPPGGDSLWARHLDCTSANLASTCKMGRHCKRVIYKRRFQGVHAECAWIQRARGHMRTENHPQRHVARDSARVTNWHIRDGTPRKTL